MKRLLAAMRDLVASLRGVRNAMLDATTAHLMAAHWYWVEKPEPENDPQEWKVELGGLMPAWAWNALVRFEIEPYPKPAIGQSDWGGEGARIVANDRRFPLGSVMTKADFLAAQGVA